MFFFQWQELHFILYLPRKWCRPAFHFQWLEVLPSHLGNYSKISQLLACNHLKTRFCSYLLYSPIGTVGIRTHHDIMVHKKFRVGRGAKKRRKVEHICLQEYVRYGVSLFYFYGVSKSHGSHQGRNRWECIIGIEWDRVAPYLWVNGRIMPSFVRDQSRNWCWEDDWSRRQYSPNHQVSPLHNQILPYLG